MEGPAPLDDLLAELWPEFSKNPWITTPGNLEIRYLGDWRWAFEIRNPALDMAARPALSDLRNRLREELGQILIRMGRSLSFDTRPAGVYSNPDVFLQEKSEPHRSL